MCRAVSIIPTAGHVQACRAGGFTLVELLVVLAIVGLLVTSMPAMIAAIDPGVRLKAAARSLADALRTARGTAILDHRETALTLDLGTGRYQGEPGGLRGLPQGIAVGFDGPRNEVNGATVAIRFFPDGTSTGGRIDLSSGKSRHWVIAHWLSGRISVDE